MGFEDDRQHLRYPISATAVIREKGGDGPPVETAVAVANISRSGLGLYSYASFDEGTPLSMVITFTSPKGTVVSDTVEGRVVWSSELGRLKEGRLYFLGISFDGELNPGKHPFLFEYLELKVELG